MWGPGSLGGQNDPGSMNAHQGPLVPEEKEGPSEREENEVDQDEGGPPFPLPCSSVFLYRVC